MVHLINRITLDVQDLSSQVCISLFRGEKNRRLIVSLVDDGKHFTIPENNYIVCYIRRADGGVVPLDCTLTDGCIICDITSDATKSIGIAECEFVVYEKMGVEIIGQFTTPPFTMVVYESQIRDIVTSNSNKSYDAILKDASDAIKDLEEKAASGYFRGPKGDKGDAGKDGKDLPVFSAEESGNFLRVDENGDIGTVKIPIFNDGYVMDDSLIDGTIVELTNYTAKNIKISCFQNCKKLRSVYLPSVETMENNAFRACSSLESVYIPKIKELGGSVFYDCTSLKYLDLCYVETLGATFARNTGLETLIIRTNKVVALPSIASVPNGTMSIYVPKNLVEDYNKSTNWSGIDCSIKAIEDYPEITGG